MKVFTPQEVADAAGGNKYLGVRVSARYAREVNAFRAQRQVVVTTDRPLSHSPYGPKKLTTQALEELTSGQIEFRLVKRRRQAP